MENNNKMSKGKLIELIVFLVIFGSILFFGFMVISDYEDRITAKDKMIDSLQTENINSNNFYAKKIDSIVTIDKEHSYSQNGKEVSIAAIVRSANQWFNEKEKLKLELTECKSELLSKKTSFSELSMKYNVQSNNYSESVNKANSIIKNQRLTIEKYDPNKYQQLDLFKGMVMKYYGLGYKTTKNADSTYSMSLIGYEKIDSALSIYEEIKHSKNFKIYDKKKK